MKKIIVMILTLLLLSCQSQFSQTKPFFAHYEIVGTTSSGKEKKDTFVFDGETTDGIITKLNFDIIRDKGSKSEISKKNIMGYLMNVSDGEILKNNDHFVLKTLSVYGYDPKYGQNKFAQFMINASINKLTTETKFKDLTFTDLALSNKDKIVAVPLEKALIAYQYLAREVGINNLNADTLVKDLLVKHELFKNNQFIVNKKRISFAGFHGGRSYGEQISAIEKYILENKMTLDQVYNMFKTQNQADTPIDKRDVIAGATIAFVGDFQRMVYLAMNGKFFEGVLNSNNKNGQTVIEVVTQGYAGEIESNITFDQSGNIVDFLVRDHQETKDVGAKILKNDSEFIQSLIKNQKNLEKIDVVAGATMTSKALKKAIEFAQKYYFESK